MISMLRRILPLAVAGLGIRAIVAFPCGARVAIAPCGGAAPPSSSAAAVDAAGHASTSAAGSAAAEPESPRPAPPTDGPGTGSGATPAPPAEAYDKGLKATQHVQAGRRLIAEGKYAEALKELAAADALLPDYCSVLLPMATAQAKLDRPNEALATLERAIRKGKGFDDRAYLQAARVFSSKNMFAEGEAQLVAWAGDRPVTANFHAALGMLRLGSFDMAPAEVELRKALEADAGNEAALIAMSQLYGSVKQYPKLQRFLDAGLAARPSSMTLLMLTGNNLLQQELFAQAKDKYERALKIDPRSSDALVNLGACLHGLGDTEGALKSFRAGIEADPKSVEAPVNLARALEMAGRPAEARDVLLAARERGIESLDVLNALADAYRLNKEYDASIAVAKESLSRNKAQPLMSLFIRNVEKERQGAAPGASTAPPPPPAGETAPPPASPAPGTSPPGEKSGAR